MLTLKICVGVFSESFKARMLKLCIYMDNELLYYGIENQTSCSYFSCIALTLFFIYPVFFVFIFRLLKLCVTISLQLIYLLLFV